MSNTVRTRDFSRRVSEIDFTADGERHVCRPALPPESVQELLALVRHENIKTDLTVMLKIFDIIMEPEEATKIAERFKKTSKNPLGLPQVLDIVTWLVEEYTSRPTTPSASSSTGSQTEPEAVDAGTTSTDGAPLAE